MRRPFATWFPHKFNEKTPIGDLCNLAYLLYAEFNPSQPSTWDLDLGGTFGV
ncbi:MAG: hypothetical protein JXA23_00750 [Bacteroidales bacterium]|nr:hypothetical protein [Bacteroidales bacterium]